MKITLDIKALSVNEAWKGRRFKTDTYKKYTRDVALLLPSCDEMTGPLEIHYFFYMKNHKMADWDNPVKPLQDILVQCGIIADDRFIYKGVVEKIPSTHEYIEIEILPYKSV